MGIVDPGIQDPGALQGLGLIDEIAPEPLSLFWEGKRGIGTPGRLGVFKHGVDQVLPDPQLIKIPHIGDPIPVVEQPPGGGGLPHREPVLLVPVVWGGQENIVRPALDLRTVLPHEVVDHPPVSIGHLDRHAGEQHLPHIVHGPAEVGAPELPSLVEGLRIDTHLHPDRLLQRPDLFDGQVLQHIGGHPQVQQIRPDRLQGRMLDRLPGGPVHGVVGPNGAGQGDAQGAAHQPDQPHRPLRGPHRGHFDGIAHPVHEPPHLPQLEQGEDQQGRYGQPRQ